MDDDSLWIDGWVLLMKMKPIIVISVVLLGLLSSAFVISVANVSGAVLTMWTHTYGGPSNDWAYSVVQTSDGGYAVAGVTGSFGAGGDFLLVKTDSSGNQQWNQTYGGTNLELAQSLIQASDGGYVLAGYTTSFGAGGMDFYLVKTDEFGVVPEFPSMLLLPVLVLFTAVVAFLSRKRPLRTIKR